MVIIGNMVTKDPAKLWIIQFDAEHKGKNFVYEISLNYDNYSSEGKNK